MCRETTTTTSIPAKQRNQRTSEEGAHNNSVSQNINIGERERKKNVENTLRDPNKLIQTQTAVGYGAPYRCYIIAVNLMCLLWDFFCFFTLKRHAAHDTSIQSSHRNPKRDAIQFSLRNFSLCRTTTISRTFDNQRSCSHHKHF